MAQQNGAEIATAARKLWRRPRYRRPIRACGAKTVSKSAPSQTTGHLIAPQTQPVSSNNSTRWPPFAWQGQVWREQEMRWKSKRMASMPAQTIRKRPQALEYPPEADLPALGGVNAQIRLQGQQLVLAIAVDNPETRALMQTEAVQLHHQMREASQALHRRHQRRPGQWLSRQRGMPT